MGHRGKLWKYSATHYNCMTGLGESCSHIGAVLSYTEYATRIRDSKTCTEEKAYWLLPGYHSVEYKEFCIHIFVRYWFFSS